MKTSETEVAKAFAFRCEWVEPGNVPDGFTYSVDKGRLLAEISRRERCGKNRHKNIKVVTVGLDLVKSIKEQRAGVFSTIQDKHPSDFEKH